MRRLLLAAPALLALAFASPALADTVGAPEFTIESYGALPEGERALYLAGLADGLDAAAAMTGNKRLTIIAACTNGFDRETLRQVVEEGAVDIEMKWAPDSPAASWFIQTMILVCQLQLPPE